MALVCTDCGQENPRDAQFCSNCKGFLEWASRAAPTSVGLPRIPGEAAGQPAPEQRTGVKIEIAEDALEVAPGGEVSTRIRVRNVGSRVEEFRLSMHGAPAGWARIEPASVNVYPGAEQEATVTFRPPVSTDVPAGVSGFAVQATSVVHSGVTDLTQGRIDVGRRPGLSADLTPVTTRGRGQGRYVVKLANEGNAPQAVRLEPRDLSGQLRVVCATGALRLAPAQRTAVAVTARAPWRLVGRPETHQFEVVVSPAGDGGSPAGDLPVVRLPGTRVALAVFTRWRPIVLSLLLLLLALAAGVVASQADEIRSGVDRLVDRIDRGNDNGQPAEQPPGGGQQDGGQQGGGQQGDGQDQQADLVDIPDVQGAAADAAKQALEDLGLRVSVQQVTVSANQLSEPTAVRTDPSAGSRVRPDSRVILLVAVPAENGQATPAG